MNSHSVTTLYPELILELYSYDNLSSYTHLCMLISLVHSSSSYKALVLTYLLTEPMTHFIMSSALKVFH